MSTYEFQFRSSVPGGTHVAVQMDDESPFIEDVVLAFEQFLLGCTFQPATIRKFVDVEGASEAISKRLRLIAAQLA